MVYGVGFDSGGTFIKTKGRAHTKVYSTWKSMLMRCYSENYHVKFPTYIDCYVCDEWLDFQVFAKWFCGNYVTGMQLDKDIKVDGNKIYGPEFCVFVSPFDNYEKAGAKIYKLKNPQGKSVEVYNLRKFCRDNNLNRSCINRVVWGAQRQHKGWTHDVITHVFSGLLNKHREI